MPSLHKIIDLQRRFARTDAAHDPGQDNFHAAMARVDDREEGQGWTEVLQNRLTVIRGEAGSGKTTEFREQAKAIRKRKGTAFVFRLDELAAGKAAFDAPEDEACCANWTSRDAEAVIFLDALDEIRLTEDRIEAPLRGALENLRTRFKGVLTASNARLIISTRPGEWRSGVDTQILQDHFRFLDPATAKIDPIVYKLIRLDRRRIANLLGELKVNVEAVLQSIDYSQAADLMRQPLEVRLLADAWREAVAQGMPEARAFTDRTDVFNRAVDGRLRETEIPEPRLKMGLERARSASERLAAVSILTGEQDFKIVDSDYGLDAMAALTRFDAKWTPLETRQLFSTALFTPGRGDALRFAHPEVRDFLAAHFFSAAIRRSSGSLDPIAPMISRAFGLELIPDSTASALAWLAALDEGGKALVSDLRPELLIQGGDPVRLSDADKMRALSSLVSRIGDKNFTGLWIAEGDIVRFASPNLQSVIADLLEQTKSVDARRTLVSLALAGQMVGLEERLLAIAVDGDDNIRVRARAAEGIAAFGSDESRKRVFDAVLSEYSSASGEVDHSRGQLIGEALAAAYPKVVDVPTALKLLRCIARERTNFTTGNDDRFREALSAAPAEHKPQWIAALDALVREPIDAAESKTPPERVRIAMRYRLLLPTLADFLTEAIESGAKSDLVLEAIEACQFGTESLGLGTFRNASMKRLRVALAARPGLVEALFWRRANRFSREDGSVRVYRAFDAMMRGDNEQGLSTPALAETFIATLQSEREPERARTAGEAGQYVCANLPHDSWRDALWDKLSRAMAVSASEKLRREGKVAISWRAPLRRRWYRLKHSFGHLRRRKFALAWYDKWRGGLRWKSRRSAIARGEDIRALASASRKALNNGGQEALDRVVRELGEDFRSPFIEGYRKAWRSIDLDGWNGWGDTIAGHALDLESNEAITALGAEEAKRAFEIALRQGPGLRGWAPALVRKHAKVFRELILARLDEEVRWLARDDAISHGTLGSLLNTEDEDRDAFRPLIFEFVDRDAFLGRHSARALVTYLAKDIGDEAEQTARFARRRFRDAMGEGSTRLAWTWAHLWLHTAPDEAWPEIATWLAKFVSPLDPDGVGFFSELHEVIRTRDGYDGFLRRPDVLAALVKFAYMIVPPGQDLEHESTYSPGPRDRAQDERHRMLKALTEAPTNASRAALQTLADDLELAEYRDIFVYNLDEQKKGAAQRKSMTEAQALMFVDREIAPPCNREELFRLVERHIRSALIRLRDGDDDEGRTFRTKNTDEDDLRNWLSGRLRDMGKDVYAVVRDNKVANDKRPDVWLGTLSDDVRVVCEVKLAERWYGHELAGLLQTQLVAQYMGEASAHAGIYLVVRCKDTRSSWTIDGVDYGMADLSTPLQSRADQLRNGTKGIDQLGVMVFDLLE